MRFINIVGLYPGKLDYMVAEAKRLQKESGLGEVAVSMTLHPEGFPAIQKPIYFARLFREYKNALEGSGIKVGILLQSLIGHGWRGSPLSSENWIKTINIHGEELGRWCPLDPGFQDYVAQTVTILAQEKPSSLLVDDDTRLINTRGLECFCPLHLERFNRMTGTEYSADELRKIISETKPGDPLLEYFEQVRQESLLEFARVIRGAIDSVDPEMRCGYCMPGTEFRIAGELTKTLAGNTKPFLRINNALYLEGDAKAFPPRMGYTQVMRKMYRDIPEVLDESDTYPQHRYSKSATSMHAHITGAILNGLNGAKLWLTNLAWPDPKTEKPYDVILGKHAGFYQELEKVMRNAQLQGPITPIHDWGKFWHPTDRNTAYWKSDWQAQVLGQFGIPARYEFPSVAGLRLLAGSDSVSFFSDDELRAMLSGALLLDGTAALEICNRGFAREIGVNAEQREFRFSFERDGETGEQLTLMNDFTCPFLTINSPNTQTLTDLIAVPFRKSPEEEVIAPGATLCHNNLGGTVAVCTGHLRLPVPNYFSPGRKRLLIKILDQLNGSPLPYVIMEEQNIYTLHAKLPDGADLLSIFNLNFDALSSIHIRTQIKTKRIEFLDGDGSWKSLAWQQEGSILEIARPLATYESVILRIN